MENTVEKFALLLQSEHDRLLAIEVAAREVATHIFNGDDYDLWENTNGEPIGHYIKTLLQVLAVPEEV